MTKHLHIDPDQMRKPGYIEFNKIPVSQYKKTIAQEKKNFSKDDFLRIYRDMRYIREFETMLYTIKTTNAYNGIDYNNPGPAHLSMGQEASSVGQAYLLTVDDFIFGSHRSHGEILAKGLSSIHKLSDAELTSVMEQFLGGDTYKVVEQFNAGKGKSVKELAIDFLLYGALAEIFAKNTGFHKGLGGSMHAFFLPFGIYPNNAIVGGSADISVGAALYKKINSKNGIVICNIGDGSMACGPVWEGLMMATMDQYNNLWEGDMKGGLPLLVNVMNNQYAMGGQTRGETMGYDFLARIGEQPGLRPLGITDSALALLSAYDWPGNVRQLQAVLFRAAVFCDGDALTAEDFPQLSNLFGSEPQLGNSTGVHDTPGVLLYTPDGNLRPLEEIEADVIRLAIGHYRGRMTEVARRLGIGRSTLYRKLTDLGLDSAA